MRVVCAHNCLKLGERDLVIGEMIHVSGFGLLQNALRGDEFQEGGVACFIAGAVGLNRLPREWENLVAI